MSSFLKIHELVKAAALFVLSASLSCLCLPALASDQLTDINTALSDVGIGVLEWVFILLVVILVCAFHDGKSRNSQDDNPQDPGAKRPD
jgi:hypothetical protein